MIYPTMGANINLGDGSIGLSTGDVLEISGRAQGSTAWLWLFTYAHNGNIYGAPINVTSGAFTSRIYDTKNLTEGSYTIVVQFGGKNTIQEVLYDPIENKFTSPWRYPITVKSSDNPYERIKQIELYCKNNAQYCDDTFYTTNVTIQKPFVTVTDMYQYSYSDIYQGKSGEKDITKSGLFLIGGETNIHPATPITIILDYNQTTVASITSKPFGYYKWQAFVNISKLRPGTHKILISSPKIDDMVTNLEIGQYIPTPKPTPTPIRIVSNSMESSEPIIIGNSPIAPSPILTMKPSDKQFVPVVTAAPIPSQVQPVQTNKPGAIIIAPTKGNTIEYSPIAVDATPTPANKIPIDPVYIIIGLVLSIIIVKRFK
jgi:hypothetical protein